MDEITRIQQWYHSQCNGDWEHTSGVKVGTLDNPGLSLEIDLQDTVLENAVFEERRYGMGIEAETSGDEWLICKVEKQVFKGFGGPYKLQELMATFLDWAENNRDHPLVTPKFEREPDNAPGPFYVIKDQCTICGLPPETAPSNITWSAETFRFKDCMDCPTHCRIERQPATEEELGKIIEAACGS